MILAAALLLQTLSSCIVVVPLIVSPTILTSFNLPSAAVGLYAPVVFGGAMISALLSGNLIARFGAWRVICLGTCLGGAGLMIIASGSLGAFVVGALIMGLSYGPGTPAGSSVILGDQPRRAGLMLSIRQTGIPVGIGLAGLVTPSLSVIEGWQGACLILGAVAISAALFVLLTLRHRRNTEKVPIRSNISLVEPLRLVLKNRDLRLTAIIITIFSGAQNCLSSFLSVFLVNRLSLDLVTAGLMIGICQMAGIVGRIAWGWCSDYWASPSTLLIVIGIATGLGLANLAALEPNSSRFAVLIAMALAGSTVAGWNGVYLAEISRSAPRGTIGTVTGATVVFAYCGFIVLPLGFSLISASEGPSFGFAVLSGLPILAVVPSFILKLMHPAKL